MIYFIAYVGLPIALIACLAIGVCILPGGLGIGLGIILFGGVVATACAIDERRVSQK